MATNYKYNIGDRVTYLGGLYVEYKTKSGTIIAKSTRKGFNYYIVVFEDGKQMELRENWIAEVNANEL